MIDFGYGITRSNRLNLDEADLSLSRKMARREKSFATCIGCGTCTAGCTAGHFTAYNPRKIQLMILNGQTENLKEDLKKCMLCGRCQMLCPRGISLRSLWSKLYRALDDGRKTPAVTRDIF